MERKVQGDDAAGFVAAGTRLLGFAEWKATMMYGSRRGRIDVTAAAAAWVECLGMEVSGWRDGLKGCKDLGRTC